MLNGMFRAEVRAIAYTMQIPSSALPGIAGWNCGTFMHFPLAPSHFTIFAALIYIFLNLILF